MHDIERRDRWLAFCTLNTRARRGGQPPGPPCTRSWVGSEEDGFWLRTQGDTSGEAVVGCLSRGQTPMLELVPPGLQIDFVGKATRYILLSVVVIFIGLASIVWRGGVTQGIDFSGGTLLQWRFSQPADLGTVRETLGTFGLLRSFAPRRAAAHRAVPGLPPRARAPQGETAR